jgi:alpha-tubulin suppressor-like RCC1 family protein
MYHSLAIRKDPATGERTAWAWGWDAYGIGGQGLPYNSDFNHPDPPLLIPSPVVNLKGVVSVAGGQYHSLAALSDGTVWAWGVNSSGQLGQLDSVVGSTATQQFITVPMQVPGISTAVAVAAGTDFSFALLSDGTVVAWGNGNDGQLGGGGDPYTPGILTGSTVIPVLHLTGVTAIAAGDRHAIALKSDGTVWAWGYNAFGQLGNPVSLNSSVPVQVQGVSGVAAISAGFTHNMALLGNGTIRLWGQNQWYELGIPFVYTSTTPVIVTR